MNTQYPKIEEIDYQVETLRQLLLLLIKYSDIRGRCMEQFRMEEVSDLTIEIDKICEELLSRHN